MVLKLLYPLLSGEADSDSDNQEGLPVTTKLNEASSDSKESKEVDGEYPRRHTSTSLHDLLA